MDREKYLLEEFALVGEEVLRASNGLVVAFTPGPKGYGSVNVGPFRIEYHRLKGCLHAGYLPDSVDHRDGNPLNNALDNLRPASPAQNVRNSRMHRDNRSGFKGVSRHGPGWRAQLYAHGKRVPLGTYRTPEEASAVYEAAALKEFGEFYRPHQPKECP